MGLLFGDLLREDSALVDVNCRVDDFCAISSITPHEESIPIPIPVGTFCEHHLTASPLPSKLAVSRAPVAQLDRASDYGSEG